MLKTKASRDEVNDWLLITIPLLETLLREIIDSKTKEEVRCRRIIR